MVRLPALEEENDPIVESPNQRQKRTLPDASLDFDTQDNIQHNLEPSRAQPQVPVMTGTHFHSLDEKGRIIVPAKLRPALGGGFWMMLDEKDNIGIYQEQTGYDILRYFEAKIADDPEDEEVAAAVERTLEAMDFVEVEGGWRVPRPPFTVRGHDVPLAPGPEHGAHTDEILAELGLDQEALTQLRLDGAIW